MGNVYSTITNKYKDSDIIFIVFGTAIVGMFVALSLFIEDTASSYLGWRMVEERFGMTATIWAHTYLALSLLPQVGSVLLTHVYMSEGSGSVGRNKWAWGAAGFEAMDFVFDLTHRSTGFEVMIAFSNAPSWTNGIGVFMVTVLTLLFTIASLFMLTLSMGIVVSSWAEVQRRYDKNVSTIGVRRRAAAAREVQEAHDNPMSHPPIRDTPIRDPNRPNRNG